MAQRILAWTRWRGRLRRRSFLWRLLAAAAIFIVLFVFLDRVAGRASTLALYPPFFAVLLSLFVRRLHDQAKSGAWLFAVLVPVLGPLLIAMTTLLRGGTKGENQYGDDPRAVGRDYLQVRIHEPG